MLNCWSQCSDILAILTDAIGSSKLNTSVRDYAEKKNRNGGRGRDGLNHYAEDLIILDAWLERAAWTSRSFGSKGSGCMSWR